MAPSRTPPAPPTPPPSNFRSNRNRYEVSKVGQYVGWNYQHVYYTTYFTIIRRILRLYDVLYVVYHTTYLYWPTLEIRNPKLPHSEQNGTVADPGVVDGGGSDREPRQLPQEGVGEPQQLPQWGVGEPRPRGGGVRTWTREVLTGAGPAGNPGSCPGRVAGETGALGSRAARKLAGRPPSTSGSSSGDAASQSVSRSVIQSSQSVVQSRQLVIQPRQSGRRAGGRVGGSRSAESAERLWFDRALTVGNVDVNVWREKRTAGDVNFLVLEWLCNDGLAVKALSKLLVGKTPGICVCTGSLACRLSTIVQQESNGFDWRQGRGNSEQPI
eukprot:1194262-Prorocentrum_minimum.AAC.2